MVNGDKILRGSHAVYFSQLTLSVVIYDPRKHWIIISPEKFCDA